MATATKQCKHPEGSLVSPVFSDPDPQIVSLLCGKCGERVTRDLRDGDLLIATDADEPEVVDDVEA